MLDQMPHMTQILPPISAASVWRKPILAAFMCDPILSVRNQSFMTAGKGRNPDGAVNGEVVETSPSLLDELRLFIHAKMQTSR